MFPFKTNKKKLFTKLNDREIKTCHKTYVKKTQLIEIDIDSELIGNIELRFAKFKINISMTENGDPLENAVAERVNGILKEEYLDGYLVDNIIQPKELLNEVIILYNDGWPHMGINNLTPEYVDVNNIKTERLMKNYWTRKTEPVDLFQD